MRGVAGSGLHFAAVCPPVLPGTLGYDARGNTANLRRPELVTRATDTVGLSTASEPYAELSTTVVRVVSTRTWAAAANSTTMEASGNRAAFID